MKTSERGVAFVAAREGIVTRAYRDVAGVWTIGVGHTAAAGEPKPARGMTITRDEALAILSRDLARCEPRVAKNLGDSRQTVFDGGVSFDFNTGAIDRATWVAAYRAGDIAGARARLMLWTEAGGRDVAGLVRRRQAEARLIFDGDYGDTGAPPTSSPEDADVLRRDLATLGFVHGPVDGEDPLAALVIAYQKSHPDLVADGIAGPATRASIARDLAARGSAGGAAGAVAAAVVAGAAVAAHASPGHAWLVAAAVAALAVAIAAVVFARHGDELKRAVTRTQGT